ncbi:MAG: hypothetical protein LH615_04360, partial [Ferruginibacter sp.]|nr:hypothetical protein [Ferruginibacter sp.]
MKKKTTLSFVSICFATILFAQQSSLNNYNKEREKISKKGIKVLAGYSVANIIYGSIAASQANSSNKYFNEMNAIWNGITLGIVGLGYLTAKKEGVLSYNESIKKQHGVEKLFLFNAGLDLAYIAGGAYLKERSKTTDKNRIRLKGYGESVMLQGGVLLLFDAIMYAIHNKHGKALY